MKSKKNNKIAIVEIEGVKAETAHVMYQDINSAYPTVYTPEPYNKMNDKIFKALENMSAFYKGIVHFSGFFGENNIFYVYYIDHHDTECGVHSLTTDEIIEAYYNAGSPACINIEMKFAKTIEA